MKSSTQIIHGGGWVTRQTTGRPYAQLFGFLSLMWLLVSIGASFPFWNGWPQKLGAVEWLCGALIVLQPVFMVLAVVFFLTEQPRTIVEEHPNPDFDFWKLY